MLNILAKSLRARLSVAFIILTIIAAVCAGTFAWHESRKSLNKLFDTQQLLFAKRLSILNFDIIPHENTQLPRSKSLLKKHRGKMDDDTLAFAIFNVDGRQVLNDGDNGKDLSYSWQRDGFVDRKLDDELWRLVWLTTPDGRYRIVVGQEWEYRDDLALDIVYSQLMPWLIVLTLMLVLLIWLVSYELRPLRNMAQRLRHRAPDDSRPLETKSLPQEVLPLINALNQLFARTHELMVHERRFISDAAHELRSPLAALKVQAEVAQLAENDVPVREAALANLHLGIDRVSRLVEQLLMLSRLDSSARLDDMQTVPLQSLLQQSVMNVWHVAQRAGIDIHLEMQDAPVTLHGQSLLLEVMLRNILDNAIRYCPAGSMVTITLADNMLTFIDNGPGVSQEYLTSLGERFFRPPGQVKTGSGLGLSIVRRIAALHNMRASFSNTEEGGFEVRLNW
ncbi:quorum sensing histidine kinase QseC [Klebsiella sp. BIGb0407]|uniref:quorum sensing histidine kinase QseC n=1 Tax=Klebsiella sp. BIGb0407 TaxID=2940603 RepID=UPI0021681205|nr:quorum sensing histidine kinase QseC [Klebsiella sp. BIGb0407]MCS3431349.1 two-component system sensor histidine kinase QseC [Klebsiella sp. BIGb0407]